MIENTKVLSAGIEAMPHEADPTVPKHVKNITQDDIDKWNKGGTETDPTVPQHVKNITEEDITKWNNGKTETDPTVPDCVKNITQEDIDKWNNPPAVDYSTAQNKPMINGTEVSGEISLEDIGAQPAGDYATKEDVDQKITDAISSALGGSY